ncbi:hypothetical protein BJ508DRAFT_334534 [Ascobolus immersus RN42]|uniref:Uncharacterized protein n=1 Tax=Ascobolus immersus RN42 TaxID=1160509 RepID=A0A3N4HTE2_ASCIM|nr:hypothetical protein BJ508DRAFT_334534 [Ascobolus immersus RN42]
MSSGSIGFCERRNTLSMLQPPPPLSSPSPFPTTFDCTAFDNTTISISTTITTTISVTAFDNTTSRANLEVGLIPAGLRPGMVPSGDVCWDREDCLSGFRSRSQVLLEAAVTQHLFNHHHHYHHQPHQAPSAIRYSLRQHQ